MNSGICSSTRPSGLSAKTLQANALMNHSPQKAVMASPASTIEGRIDAMMMYYTSTGLASHSKEQTLVRQAGINLCEIGLEVTGRTLTELEGPMLDEFLHQMKLLIMAVDEHRGAVPRDAAIR